MIKYFIILIFLILSSGVSSADLPSNVTTCGVISSPGTYTLTQDIINENNTLMPFDTVIRACILINTNDVIFNGGGHTIDGIDAEQTIAIFTYNNSSTYVTNTTITNFTLTDWYYGILLYPYSNNSTISNNIVNSNIYGIYTYLSKNDTIINNSASLNEYGIILYYRSRNSTISGNTMTANTIGLTLYNQCDNNIVHDNTITSSTDTGVYIYNSNNNIIYNNYIQNINNIFDNGINIYGSNTILEVLTGIRADFQTSQNNIYLIATQIFPSLCILFMILGFGAIIGGLKSQRPEFIIIGIIVSVIGFGMILVGNYLITSIVSIFKF